MEASTTAGSQLATAVPEVQTRATGRPAARATPRAKKALGALVEVDMDPEAAVPGEGEGDRGGARPR